MFLLQNIISFIGLFCKSDHLFYRVFLQKRPVILRSLLIVATPYEPQLVTVEKIERDACFTTRVNTYIYTNMFACTYNYVPHAHMTMYESLENALCLNPPAFIVFLDN